MLSNTTDDAIAFTAYIRWDYAFGTMLYSFHDDTLRNYAAQVAADITATGTSAKAITLTIGGLDFLAENTVLSVQPVLETTPGITAQGSEATWIA